MKIFEEIGGSDDTVVLHTFWWRAKIIDTYYNVSLQDAKFFAEAPWEKVEPEYDKIIKYDTELTNIGFVRQIVKNYDENRAMYVHRPVEDTPFYDEWVLQLNNVCSITHNQA